MEDRGPRTTPKHRRVPRSRSARAGMATALLLALACVLASAAQAGTGLSVTPTFPTNSTVGDTNLAASLTIINANTGTDVSAAICNSGDAAPCPLGSEGITLMGSCGGQGADAACVLADPGVFQISSTAFGAPGSACANLGFAVVPIAGPTARSASSRWSAT